MHILVKHLTSVLYYWQWHHYSSFLRNLKLLTQLHGFKLPGCLGLNSGFIEHLWSNCFSVIFNSFPTSLCVGFFWLVVWFFFFPPIVTVVVSCLIAESLQIFLLQRLANGSSWLTRSRVKVSLYNHWNVSFHFTVSGSCWPHWLDHKCRNVLLKFWGSAKGAGKKMLLILFYCQAMFKNNTEFYWCISYLGYKLFLGKVLLTKVIWNTGTKEYR